MKTTIRLLLVVTVIALGFAGVGRTARAATTLEVAVVQGVESAGIKSVIPDWEKKTGNKVDLIELPYPNLQDKVFTDAQSATGSYDVIMIDDPWMPFLAYGDAGKSYLTPLASLGYKTDDDFVKRSLDVSSWPPPSGRVCPAQQPTPSRSFMHSRRWATCNCSGIAKTC